MLEQIQQLIAEGNTEEALALLAQHSSDALLLQARYNAGKKQYNMGLIEFSEWQRTQAQINYAALELAKSVGKASGGNQAVGGGGNNPASPQPLQAGNSLQKVFISYNHNDREYADRIYAFLKNGGLDPVIDVVNMKVGEKIKDFILNQIRENNTVLSLVSKNSLRSGWVGLESDLALYSQLLTNQKFIPVSIDNAVFDDDFFFEVMDEIENKIADLDKKIEKAKDRKFGYKQFQTQRDRLEEQHQNLPKIIEHFQGVLNQDIGEGRFESGMQKVVDTIKS